jgi:hypothetical protein
MGGADKQSVTVNFHLGRRENSSYCMNLILHNLLARPEAMQYEIVNCNVQD